ncbi:ABC transporter permease subunit [Vibrio sinaloensis]|nr:ABC transporter permease subunit [Vibrio sinaloensis]
MSILILPVIIRTTEEALMAVPQTYREGSYALGSSKIYTIWRLILPSATPGILTSVILSIGRVIGESAPCFPNSWHGCSSSRLSARLGSNVDRSPIQADYRAVHY